MKESKTIAALFDFDGVVMDTETQYSIFWGEQGRKYRPDLPNFDRIIKGQTLVQIYDKYFEGMEKEKEQISKDLLLFEENMVYDYIPGVLDFIEDLKKNDVKMAVVTSSDIKKMENVYRAHPEVLDIFDSIITADLFKQSKPNPECFLLGAEILGSTPKNSFVFEDSFHGLKAGNAAGSTVIGLATTNPREAIQDKADYVIDDFKGFTFDKLMSVRG